MRRGFSQGSRLIHPWGGEGTSGAVEEFAIGLYDEREPAESHRYFIVYFYAENGGRYPKLEAEVPPGGWEVLGDFADLFTLMSNHDDVGPTIAEFLGTLEQLGIEDITHDKAVWYASVT